LTTSAAEMDISRSWVVELRTRLRTWYDADSRELPWRQTGDPYRIWVSEIMLQQTQVITVIDYYQRFIAAFPSIEHLAAAPQARVLKLWEGLGYYARARNLHKGACEIVSRHGNGFPRDLSEIRRIPGVGAYTAAAIASIAFSEKVAVVDGNVSRVLCRTLRFSGDPRSSSGVKILTEAAQMLLDPDAPGEHNQAMMELGALICNPRSPACGRCPVETLCAARSAGEVKLYPLKRSSKSKPHRNIAAALIWKGDLLLIARRPENGLLGGLWEFPGGKIEKNETPQQAVGREVLEETGLKVKVKDLFQTVEHGYSHFSITMQVYHCEYLSGSPQPYGCTDVRWVRVAELDDFAFPKANRIIIDRLMELQS